MREIISSQAFGVMLAMLFYLLGGFLYRKTKFPLFNPLLVATVLLILYVKIVRIELSVFLTDLSGISLFLGPLIVSLAVPIVKNIDLIKKHFIPIIVASVVGAFVSMFSVILLGRLFNLDPEIISSVIPKSSTTPIAIEVSARLGGIRPITVAVVVSAAVLGAVILPIIIKVFKIKDPLIIGLGLGSTSHAVGTAKALEIDATAGAIAGISLVISGVATALIALFL